jgi:hypothetical protein
LLGRLSCRAQVNVSGRAGHKDEPVDRRSRTGRRRFLNADPCAMVLQP